MAASGDVTIAQDGGSVKAHPYLVALVRWCVSCLWSSATVLLHRLLAGYTLRPSITASKPPPKPRTASTDHLHPEPRVECQVLHAPKNHSLDVIFVHGLYGSLGNTWRQGDWRSKYKLGPNKVPLLRPSSCTCLDEDRPKSTHIYDEVKLNEVTFDNINEKLTEMKKILPNEEVLITENFFDHTVLDQEIMDNLETQARFVRDLFENENRRCSDESKCNNKIEMDLNEDSCECRLNDGRKCEVGCGCTCDDCYSSCWPRDWVKEDYPEARVISINYTSDPHLWRPLWIKECKRLRLHERAEQMTKQLLDLGVGERPVIWVGHSKGGLFIKQIYCEAYEAHLKLTKHNQKKIHTKRTNDTDYTSSNNEMDHLNIINDKDTIDDNNKNTIDDNNKNTINDNLCDISITKVKESNDSFNEEDGNDSAIEMNNNFNDRDSNDESAIEMSKNFSDRDSNDDSAIEMSNHFNDRDSNDDSAIEMSNHYNDRDSNDDSAIEMSNHYNDRDSNDDSAIEMSKNFNERGGNDDSGIEMRRVGDESAGNEEIDEGNNTLVKIDDGNSETSSNNEEDYDRLSKQASLWARSAGFMFYSVPHRGSPLAGIKTPLTARSIELLEISKDCSLVLSLQDRWLQATEERRPQVRSLVETCRTLMSVLWLRIVSVPSADAGIGALYGVSVDHREICKPSSRQCLLYEELMNLMRAALNQCRCESY